jgi:DNA-binding transcriptional regulator PaaX
MNAPANAKKLLKALIDRQNLDLPLGRINEVAAEIGLDEDEVRPAIEYCKAMGWLEVTKMGGDIKPGWLSVTPAGKAAVKS